MYKKARRIPNKNTLYIQNVHVMHKNMHRGSKKVHVGITNLIT